MAFSRRISSLGHSEHFGQGSRLVMSIVLAVARWMAWMLVLRLGPRRHRTLVFLAEHLDGMVLRLAVLGETKAVTGN